MLDTNISRRTLLGALGAGALSALPGCGGGSDGPNWGSLDKLLADAVAQKDAPFLVAAVTDRKGILWQGAAGQATSTLKASQDVVFHLYSATKAIGGLAAMIMVDRGKLSLDTTVASVLPDFANIKVLQSLGPSGPVYRDPVRPVTLRHLLTHTSGLAYNSWNQTEFDWEVATNAASVTESSIAGFTHPLMFDPGDGWTYGVGLDWAGFMVEKVDGRSIDQFVHEEIFAPLQMSDTMFETDAAKSRLADPKLRAADGSFVGADFIIPPARPPVYGMGQALHGTALDYTKFLRLVLNDGEVNGRRILSSNVMAYMKQNQMGSLRIPMPVKATMPDLIGADMDLFPGLGIPMTHTTGFMRNEVDVPGRRRAGSLTWGGVLNTHYWIDPTTGIGAVLFSQSLPFIEPRWMSLYSAFEKAVYSEYNKS